VKISITVLCGATVKVIQTAISLVTVKVTLPPATFSEAKATLNVARVSVAKATFSEAKATLSVARVSRVVVKAKAGVATADAVATVRLSDHLPESEHKKPSEIS